MQLRKLIRLLKNAEKKVGPYAQVTIDTERYKDWGMEWTHDAVSDVDTDHIPFYDTNTDGYYENGKDRAVVILNQH